MQVTGSSPPDPSTVARARVRLWCVGARLPGILAARDGAGRMGQALGAWLRSCFVPGALALPPVMMAQVTVSVLGAQLPFSPPPAGLGWGLGGGSCHSVGGGGWLPGGL